MSVTRGEGGGDGGERVLPHFSPHTYCGDNCCSSIAHACVLRVCLVKMSDILNYATAQPRLVVNKLLVEQLTIVGLLVEQVSNIARVKRIHVVWLVEADLPGYFELSLDGKRCVHKVVCFEEERWLVLYIARKVRDKLSKVAVFYNY